MKIFVLLIFTLIGNSQQTISTQNIYDKFNAPRKLTQAVQYLEYIQEEINSVNESLKNLVEIKSKGKLSNKNPILNLSLNQSKIFDGQCSI